MARVLDRRETESERATSRRSAATREYSFCHSFSDIMRSESGRYSEFRSYISCSEYVSNSLKKYSFLSSGHLRRHCNVFVAVIVGSLTIHSSFKLASNDWQARKDSRSRSRRRPAVLRSAHPAPDPQPGDRAVVVEGWPACRRNRQPDLGHGGRPDR